MHAGKTLGWPGATPLLGAFSRPKVGGVAPGRHRGTVTVFCPRAYGDVINLNAHEKIIPNEEIGESRWQF
jgi:hypothetical protein